MQTLNTVKHYIYYTTEAEPVYNYAMDTNTVLSMTEQLHILHNHMSSPKGWAMSIHILINLSPHTFSYHCWSIVSCTFFHAIRWWSVYRYGSLWSSDMLRVTAVTTTHVNSLFHKTLDMELVSLQCWTSVAYKTVRQKTLAVSRYCFLPSLLSMILQLVVSLL